MLRIEGGAKVTLTKTIYLFLIKKKKNLGCVVASLYRRQSWKILYKEVWGQSGHVSAHNKAESNIVVTSQRVYVRRNVVVSQQKSRRIRSDTTPKF